MMNWIKEHVDSLKEIVKDYTSDMSSGDKLKLGGIIGIVILCLSGGSGGSNGGSDNST